MKRMLCFLFALCMLVSAIPSASVKAIGEEKQVLSSLDNESCYEMLTANGFVFPEELCQSKKEEIVLNGGLRKAVSYLEEDLNYGSTVSHPIRYAIYESLREAVINYYGYDTNTVQNVARSMLYTLQDSDVAVSWNSNMKNYNCYAYALGRTDAFYEPGEFVEEGYDDDDGVSVLADLTKQDLQVLGYNCVKTQSYRPTSYGSWSNIMALRRETENEFNNLFDFHFAKLSASDLTWLHKPGSTGILRFKNAPSNSVEWSNESYNGVEMVAPNTWYDSNIVYILYKTNHGGTTRVWTGEHYHSGTQHYYLYANVCSDCGDYKMTYWVSEDCSGPPCSVPNRIIQPELER